MSNPAWQKRCGEVNGYDHEAARSCGVPMRDLATEFDVMDRVQFGWLYEVAAYADCAEKCAIKSFKGRGTLMPRRHKPANDNGRES